MRSADKRQKLRALARPGYLPGDYLAAQELQTEQLYRLQRVRHHNRYLHGWGVVCGLWVVPVKDPRRPWAVQVCPGYAIGPCGDELEVGTPAVVDVRDYLWRRPRDPGEPAQVAYVGIRYAEQHVRPIPTNPPGCGCDDTIYEPSRIRDSFQVDVLWALPETDGIEGFDLCEPRLVPCPDSPNSLYVILACIALPISEGDPITMDRIDNFVRRQLSSTATLQEQLITCCCKEEPQPTPEANLRITKREKERSSTPGGLSMVTYEIAVTNDGPSVARNVIVTDTLTMNSGFLVRVADFATSQGSWIQTEPPGPFVAQLGELGLLRGATLEFTAVVRGQEPRLTDIAIVSSDNSNDKDASIETDFSSE